VLRPGPHVHGQVPIHGSTHRCHLPTINSLGIANAPSPVIVLFVWIISNQPAVLFLSEQISTNHQPPAKRTGCMTMGTDAGWKGMAAPIHNMLWPLVEQVTEASSQRGISAGLGREVRCCALTRDERPLTPLGLPCPEALPVWAGGHCIVVGIHGREAKKAPAPVLRAETAQGTCPLQIERQQLVGNLAEDRLEQFGELLVTQFGVTCIHIREKRIMGN
jgi:hypothetical protein